MFAATVDDAGVYRLSIRRIRTIKTYMDYGKTIDLRFKSRAKAKACADEINATWLQDYDKNFNKATSEFVGTDHKRKNEIMIGIITIIEKHMT